jgi:serine/threonine protein kinase
MFGGSDGLTEDTYLDWILGRAKRIFLTLVECNCSDQIFGIAEDAWDDDDLPIALSEIPRLALSYKDDDSLNKKFYSNQFQFLLRPLNLHGHIDYAPNEVVPTEYVHKMAPSAALQKWSRFHLPKMPTLIYAKRKVILGEKNEIKDDMLDKFLEDVHTGRNIEHEHIAAVMASWTHKNAGYIMTSFVGEHTLRSFIDFRTPSSMQKVSGQDRSKILLQWLHCLADAVAYLHRKRIAHAAICPSNIVVDENNNIAFSDLGFLETFQKDKKFEADELYIYGAPEHFDTEGRVSPEEKQRLPLAKRGFFRKRRNSNSSNHSGSDTSETAPALSVDSKGHYIFKPRSNSDATITPITSRASLHSTSTTSHPRDSTLSSHRASTSSKGTTAATSINSEARSATFEGNDRTASDIYSLSCVFLELISFVLKRKPHEFTKHRATKYKNTSGKGTHTDTSFHSNPQKVQTWMEILENEVSAMQAHDPALAAIPLLFQLIAEMQHPHPAARPSAADVQERLYDALSNHGGIQDLHCLHTNDLRPASTTLSFARSSTSGGSSEPRLAAFPEIASLIPPPVPSKSPRRPKTSGTTLVGASIREPSSRPTTPRRADTDITAVPPVPPLPLPLKNSSMLDLRHWGRHRRDQSAESRRAVGISV